MKKSKKEWYLYIVRCKKGALYTGITLDVDARIKQHNDGKGSKAVKALGLPVTLVYKEKVGTFSKALKKEAEVKKMSKEEKEKLIQ